VSAYVGSSKNLKDLKDPALAVFKLAIPSGGILVYSYDWKRLWETPPIQTSSCRKKTASMKTIKTRR